MTQSEAKKKLKMVCERFKTDITLEDLKTESDKDWYAVLHQIISLVELSINKNPNKKQKPN